MNDTRSKKAARWPLVGVSFLLVAAAACEEDRKGGERPAENQSTCTSDDQCNGRQVCSESRDVDPNAGGLPSLAKSCLCVVGQRGATCAFDTDCGPAGSGRTCSPTQCECEGGPGGPGDDGGPGQPDGGQDGEPSTPSPKACVTKDDCKRDCDCDGDGTMECSYTFACENGFCYEEPPSNGYSYATCEDRICNLCQ